MSTPCYSSMHICICLQFSTQTHSYPEGDRKGVAFTPFQYKQHIKKLKSAIEPKSIPNIPTSASGSEFPKFYWIKFSQMIILDELKAYSPLHLGSIQLYGNHLAGVKPFPHKTLE
ncbi:hypothetical protein O181_061722 [Austropuccinia psidii MF-1]|uniref:Uncharacterized protein n=1 Tax=Austropuccinia psidii MF-1 TaxID=1389203 RepID=A0A9Q3EL90_9BASI|nr:hypothetical protein [Austropuccinia psidii MF-1]